MFKGKIKRLMIEDIGTVSARINSDGKITDSIEMVVHTDGSTWFKQGNTHYNSRHVIYVEWYD